MFNNIRNQVNNAYCSAYCKTSAARDGIRKFAQEEAGVETLEWLALALTVVIIMTTIGAMWDENDLGTDVAEAIKGYFADTIDGLRLGGGEG